MRATFTADELFQVALEMEETGQVFYEALAAGAGSPFLVDFFHRLADQEAEHNRKFQKMRQEHAAKPQPLTLERLDFAQQLINSWVMPTMEQSRRTAKESSPSAAIDMAITMEENSVKFYRELAGGLTGEDAKVLQGIIEEEKSHINWLQSAKKHP